MFIRGWLLSIALGMGTFASSGAREPKGELNECAKQYERLDVRTIPILHTADEVLASIDRVGFPEAIEAFFRPEDFFTAAELKKINRFRAIQNILDKGITLALTPVWVPLLAITATLKFFDTPHESVLFFQERIGERGRPFTIIKLRTFNISRGTSGGDSTPYKTRMGRFMRRMKLDELCQFINVLRGEMSLVGPRPVLTRPFRHTLSETAVAGYRTLVKPGLTGWAQVHTDPLRAEYAQLTERVEYDLYEIKHMNIRQYFRTLFRTPYVIFRGAVFE